MKVRTICIIEPGMNLSEKIELNGIFFVKIISLPCRALECEEVEQHDSVQEASSAAQEAQALSRCAFLECSTQSTEINHQYAQLPKLHSPGILPSRVNTLFILVFCRLLGPLCSGSSCLLRDYQMLQMLKNPRLA